MVVERFWVHCGSSWARVLDRVFIRDVDIGGGGGRDSERRGSERRGSDVGRDDVLPRVLALPALPRLSTETPVDLEGLG